MKKYLLVVWGMALLSFSCSDHHEKGNESDTPGGSGNSSTVVVDETVKMEAGSFIGMVKDRQGNLLSGVNVQTGEETTVTDETGMFHFERIGVVNNRSVLKFTKDGYFQVVRSWPKQSETSTEVVMHSQGNSTISCEEIFASSSGKQLKVSEMKVTLPANAMVIEESGKAYTGNVKADMLYLDPNNEHFAEMMPGGDLSAIRSDESEVALLSYGIINVSLKAEDGTPLQLKEGNTSEVSFPVPEGMESNPPETMPLWHFNEKAGIWVESGVATLEGDKYVGEVSHFSAINLDEPKERALIEGKVTDCRDNPLRNVTVKVGQKTMQTNSLGRYSVFVPANTPVKVSAYSKVMGQPDRVITYSIPGQSGNSSYTQNIKLPCTYTVKGQVVNTCDWSNRVVVNFFDNDSRLIGIQLCDAEGKFDFRLPENYTGPTSLRIETEDGVIKKNFVVNQDVDLKEIPICTKVKGGKITFFFNNKSVDFDHVVQDNGEGVWIVDNKLVWENDFICLEVEDYAADKTSYENVYLSLAVGNDEFDGKAKVNIIPDSKGGVNIGFVSGAGKYVENGLSYNATISSGKFSVPIVLRGTIKMDVHSLDKDFPQLITVPMPVDKMMLIIESPVFGKGGTLYYKNKEMNDYYLLKEAIENSNYKLIYSDEDSYYREVWYQSGDRFINLFYYEDGVEDYWSDYEEKYLLGLTFYDGCILDMEQILGGYVDEGVTAKSLSNKRRSLL